MKISSLNEPNRTVFLFCRFSHPWLHHIHKKGNLVEWVKQREGIHRVYSRWLRLPVVRFPCLCLFRWKTKPTACYAFFFIFYHFLLFPSPHALLAFVFFFAVCLVDYFCIFCCFFLFTIVFLLRVFCFELSLCVHWYVCVLEVFGIYFPPWWGGEGDMVPSILLLASKLVQTNNGLHNTTATTKPKQRAKQLKRQHKC